MLVHLFQMSTLLCLAGLLVKLYGLQRKEHQEHQTEEMAAPVWTVICERTGSSAPSLKNKWIRNKSNRQTQISLEEGDFYVGNSFWRDDVLVDLRENGRIYLHVEREEVLLTVLQGQIVISGHNLERNETKEYPIRTRTKVEFYDMTLTFQKIG